MNKQMNVAEFNERTNQTDIQDIRKHRDCPVNHPFYMPEDQMLTLIFTPDGKRFSMYDEFYTVLIVDTTTVEWFYDVEFLGVEG